MEYSLTPELAPEMMLECWLTELEPERLTATATVEMTLALVKQMEEL